MGNSKVSITVFLGMAVFVSVTVFIYSSQRKAQKELPQINSFEACAQAGHPVAESFPRRCTVPRGRTFIENSVQIECGSDNNCPAGTSCVNHLCVNNN